MRLIIETFGKISNLVFYPLNLLHPVVAVVILSFFLSLIISFLQKIIFRKENLVRIKREMEEIKERIIKSKETDKNLIDKLYQLNKIIIKENVKIILITIFIGLFGISWVEYNYSGSFVKLPLPVVKSLNIIYFYIIVTLIIGIVLSKLMEVS
ncbi:MAG: hypothetical protein QXD89_00945 [Candidatus Aenigmatarchaeota archaeon]